MEKNSIAPVVAPPPQPAPQQEFRTEYKPLQKQRKVLQSQSQPTPSPKRARLSSDNSQLMTPVTKTEQLAPISTSNEVVQFKMEPYDQNQSISIDETPDETFGDDSTLDEANVDDTEDYSMMEGGEEEPQAGTSAEGAGEGQGRCLYDWEKYDELVFKVVSGLWYISTIICFFYCFQVVHFAYFWFVFAVEIYSNLCSYTYAMLY